MTEKLPPILQFDPNPTAILNPDHHRPSGNFPRRAVLCFFNDVLKDLEARGRLTVVEQLNSEIGRNPVYELDWRGEKLLVLHPGVGAPLAAGFLEETIALGARSFIACGGCGSLQQGITAGHPVVLTGAVRDEGTSYHYLPAGVEALASAEAVTALENVLQSKKLLYTRGKSWTTDAIYRETADRRAARMEEGCVVVEMEAAAFFTVAAFRKVTFGQIVYAGDLVVPEGWDQRDWNNRRSDRELVFWLAVEACAALPG